MVSEFKPPQGMKKYLCSAFNADEMSFVLQRLLDLRDFMNKNSGFASFLMAETFSATAAAQSHSTLRAGVVGRTGKLLTLLSCSTRRLIWMNDKFRQVFTSKKRPKNKENRTK